jgi:hypothetical protein
MIEQQLRDGLQAAVTKEPPLGFDPDTLVDDARRSARRRRTTIAAFATAAAVAAGSVGAVVVATGGSGSPTRLPATRSGTESPDVAVRRVGESLAKLLPQVHAGAESIDVRVDPASDRHVGVILYDEGKQHFALAYGFGECRTPSDAEFCPPGNEVRLDVITDGAGDVRTATAVRDEVGIQLGTSDTIEGIGSVTRFFTTDNPCDCPAGGWASIPKPHLTALLQHEGLDLPGATDLPPAAGIEAAESQPGGK